MSAPCGETTRKGLVCAKSSIIACMHCGKVLCARHSAYLVTLKLPGTRVVRGLCRQCSQSRDPQALMTRLWEAALHSREFFS